jgi:hypothetical protein
MTNTHKFIVVPALTLAVLGGGALLGYASLASAETSTTGSGSQVGMHMGMHGGRGSGGPHGRHGHNGVMGTVTAVNGSTITVTGMDGTSYSVTVDTAKVERVVVGALTDIQVGDRIGVHGAVSGTTVTADRIMDDIPEPPEKPMQNQTP